MGKGNDGIPDIFKEGLADLDVSGLPSGENPKISDAISAALKFHCSLGEDFSDEDLRMFLAMHGSWLRSLSGRVSHVEAENRVLRETLKRLNGHYEALSSQMRAMQGWKEEMSLFFSGDVDAELELDTPTNSNQPKKWWQHLFGDLI